MKKLRCLAVGFVLVLGSLQYSPAQAQCSMCTLNAENSVQNGSTEGKGLNSGILYLLAAPYLAVAGVGFMWYKKYRRKNIPIHVKNTPINLN